jgi:hypothetical protein
VRGWCFTINLSSRSTILLPDESNANDDHDHSIDYCGDDGRSPDFGLVGWGRHGVKSISKREVFLKGRGNGHFSCFDFGEKIRDEHK